MITVSNTCRSKPDMTQWEQRQVGAAAVVSEADYQVVVGARQKVLLNHAMGGQPPLTLQHCTCRKWPKQPVASQPHNRRNAQQPEFAKSRVMGAAFDIHGLEQSVNSL